MENKRSHVKCSQLSLINKNKRSHARCSQLSLINKNKRSHVKCSQLSLINKNKKGAGNIEMVIAFIFFLGFVAFLFFIIRPGSTDTLSGSVIAELHDTFEDEANTNLSYVFLRSNYSDDGNPDCFILDLPAGLFRYDIKNTDSYVAMLSGGEVDSDINNELLSISNESNFFKVFISPEFDDELLGGCGQLDDFALGSIVERKVISYSALENMRDEYYSDYSTLRNKLGVPPIYDFSITAENMPEIAMIPELGIPDAVDIIAKDYIFEVIKSDGTFTNEKINFRIW